jgi:hypothetical protein
MHKIIDYKTKYLKYKNKYLVLKKMAGGFNNPEKLALEGQRLTLSNGSIVDKYMVDDRIILDGMFDDGPKIPCIYSVPGVYNWSNMEVNFAFIPKIVTETEFVAQQNEKRRKSLLAIAMSINQKPGQQGQVHMADELQQMIAKDYMDIIPETDIIPNNTLRLQYDENLPNEIPLRYMLELYLGDKVNLAVKISGPPPYAMMTPYVILSDESYNANPLYFLHFIGINDWDEFREKLVTSLVLIFGGI